MQNRPTMEKAVRIQEKGVFKLIGLFLAIVGSTTLYAQRDAIEISFEDGHKKTIQRTYANEGTTTVKIKVKAVRLSSTIDMDFKVFPTLHYGTADNKDIELITKYIYFDSTALMSDSIVYKEIEVKLFNAKEDLDESCHLTLQSDSITYNANKHLEYLTIINKSVLTLPSLSDQEDTIKIGTIQLNYDSDLILYRKIKWHQRKTSRKQFRETHDSLKVKLKDKRFLIKYTPVDTIRKRLEFVEVQIAEGRMSTIDVKVKGTSGYYKNKGPVSVTNFEARRNYRLEYSGHESELMGTYIPLKNVLNYNSLTDKKYFPSMESLQLNGNEQVKFLNSAGSPLTFFDARVYTDPKGLSGQENGLVQTEISARFISNSNSIGRTYLTFFQNVRLGLNWSKFDSKYDTLKFNQDTDVVDADLLHMVQYANSGFNIEIDLLSGSNVHDVFLTAGHNLYHTKTYSDSTFRRVFTPSIYGVIGGKLRATKRIDASFKLPVHFLYTHDQPFEYSNNSKFHLMIAPEIEISIDLKKKKEGDETQTPFAFGRIRYFDLPNVRSGNFWQIQLGVEIPLTETFK